VAPVELKGERLMRAVLMALFVAVAVSRIAGGEPRKLRTLADFQPAAARARAALELPRFEQTPAEVEASAKGSMAEADRRLASLAAQDPARVTFENTIAALDAIGYPVSVTAERLLLMKETRTDKALREAAGQQLVALQEWSVGVVYREDVYKACRAFEDAYRSQKRPPLAGEDLKLFEDTMRDYRRAGLHLDRATRDRVEALQKQLARLSNDFEVNITNAKKVVTFTREELEGVPESFLEGVKNKEGTFDLLANVTPHAIMLGENARPEATRRRFDEARSTLAQAENGPLLAQIVGLRDQIAALLGYKSWDDYQVEPRMAKTGTRAQAFLEDLNKGLQPKFRAELASFSAMKAADTGGRDATIKSWDWRYYENQLKKREHNVDAEALRVFFPMERCLTGMFEVYQRIFGLKFEQIENPAPWFENVTLWVVTDAASGEPLGTFYLDLFPRDGKFNHFAEFPIIDGRLRADGLYQRPVVALICNFTAPGKDRPSLLTHAELETLFHEFGHAMHSILTRAKYGQFAGTNVPRDFVEAPSQMLEAWTWDPAILNRFAADYRDPSRKIDAAVIKRLKEARLATSGTDYCRQLALGLGDLRLHAAPVAGQPKDPQAILNQTFAEVFLAPPEGSHFGAYWGHLVGYDAGYYGYLWSKAIAEDMATAFEKSKDGFLSEEVGMRLRNDVYAAGGSRDAEDLVRTFLGRERSNQPLLESLGIGGPSSAR
jgi:thimet oligopeptidase